MHPMTTTSREPIVLVKGVQHAFGTGEGRTTVLFDNNLTMYPGEIVIMTGPSGSGKTTLLTLIGALRSIQQGSLRVLGQELSGMSPKQQVELRKNIGFIFQAHNLFDSLTAFQNVLLATELFPYTRREAECRSEEILTRLGLREHMHKKPHQLSGGQQQRVAIGRALVNHPKLVFADEPTAALDKTTGRLVVSILREMADTLGTTILIVTHDNRILDVADRIIKMVDGYVVADVNCADSVQTALFLKSCAMFKDMTPAIIRDVSRMMKEEDYGTGVTIVSKGEVGDRFFLIKSGRAEVFDMVDGRKVVLATLGAGEFFGERALLEHKPRAAWVRSLEPIHALTLTKEYFNEVLQMGGSFEDQLRSAYFNS